MTTTDPTVDDWADQLAFALPALRAIWSELGALNAADDCSRIELKQALGAALCAAERLNLEIACAKKQGARRGAQARGSPKAAQPARSARAQPQSP